MATPRQNARRFLIFRDGTNVTDKEYAKGHFTYAEIRQHGQVYMRRWYLLVFPRWFSVRIHHIKLPDHDRWPHDHPWAFLSIILRGGYTEWHCTPATFDFGPAITERYDQGGVTGWKNQWMKFKVKRVRFFNFHRNTDLHQIRIFERGAHKGSWTLIFTGPERREWGFQTDQGWVSRVTLNLGASAPRGPEPD